MFNKIKSYGSKMYDKVVEKTSVLQTSALGTFVAATVVAGGGEGKGIDMASLGCTIQDLAFKTAFFGAIVGLMMYGVYKIISIVNPSLASQVSNYLKDAIFGLIIVAVAGGVVGFLGQMLFGTDFGALC